MMNIDQYDYDTNSYMKMKQFKILPLSDEGAKSYLGPSSHVHNYLPNKIK